MNEIINAVIAAIELVGSVCSILAFLQDGLVRFRRRRRRNKMID